MKIALCLSLLLIVFSRVLGQQDTLKLNLEQYQMTSVMKSFLSRDRISGVIILTSKSFDAQFIQLLNQYRQEKNLNTFSSSLRLDTLGLKEMHYIRDVYGDLIHYPKIKEMKPYINLLGAENLSGGTISIGTARKFISFEMVSPEKVLQGWKNSPKHNDNMLSKNVDETSFNSSLIITFEKEFFTIKSYYVLELDNHQRTPTLTKWVPKGKPIIKNKRRIK